MFLMLRMCLTALLLLCVPQLAATQATDLVCSQCVETGDIANEAVHRAPSWRPMR